MKDDKFEAQKKYDKTQRDDGLIRVTAWIPRVKRDEFLDYAEDLREKKRG